MNRTEQKIQPEALTCPHCGRTVYIYPQETYGVCKCTCRVGA